VLSLALARTAALDGAAVVLNGVSIAVAPPAASGSGPSDPRVLVGVDGEPFELSARVVVDARGHAGPDDAARARPGRFLRAAVARASLPLDAALVLPGEAAAPPVCCVPGRSHTRLGMIRPSGAGAAVAGVARVAGVEQMLGTVNRRLDCQLGPEHVTATWEETGPAPDADDEDLAVLTRRHPLREVAPGVVSVMGGTVTTYRDLARETVDAVVGGLDERTRLRLHRRSLTHRLQLRGSVGWEDVRDGHDLGGAAEAVDDATRHRLAHRYGGEARVLLAMVAHRPEWRRPLVEGLPYLEAEAVYAVRYEMARTLLDVLARRAPALLEDAAATAAAAGRAATVLADETGWDLRRRAREIASVREEAQARRAAAPPSPTRASPAADAGR
jgi:glycerol-3-phosphate dehydrogenase